MIGQLTVQALKAAGWGKVIAVDLDESRLEKAKQCGAEIGLNAGRADLVEEIRTITGGGAHAAFEVAGMDKSFKAAVDCVRKGGTVVLVGNSSPKVEMALQTVVTKELSLLGSCASRGEYPQCLDLMGRRKIDVRPLISAVAPLEEGASWFARLYAHEAGLMKVILTP
jgi:threonine dehydrogenase-like Zn-dependent dehydrogenase